MLCSLLDEEFFREYPVTVYHGPHCQDGTVIAKVSTPRVDDGNIVAVTERCLHEGVEQLEAHQRLCPWDNRNAAELGVTVKALREVQAEKQRLGIPLDAPLLTGPPILTLLKGGLDPEP